jgi:phosphoribosylformylglycinamidine synthase subunit PurQ / glutaminase
MAMKAAVITFPGSNCDRDLVGAFAAVGFDVARVWHKDTDLPVGVDVVGIPGGFSFGDYLRCGAIAARSPIAGALQRHAARGGYVLGICNGFQVLTETGLLPGALMRNAGLKFICKSVGLRVGGNTAFTAAYQEGQTIHLPIAHHDGNYTADEDTLRRLDGEGRVAFRYTNNPNGAMNDIAGIVSDNRRVLGLMPHPERAADARLGSTDGLGVFQSLMGGMALA